jgi:hypothetical protein
VHYRAVSEEMRKSVATAIADATLLSVPDEALRISRICGIAPDVVVNELVAAAIRAQVNMEFGSCSEAMRNQRTASKSFAKPSVSPVHR